MRTTLLAAVGAVLAAGLTTVAPTNAAVPSASSSQGADVRVASFNVQSVSLDRDSGAQKPWRKRRGAVIANILGEDVDVIGVQEANPSRYWRPRLVHGATQFLDLRNGLNAAGGSYRLANATAFNCVNPRTAYHCAYQYRGASQSERILYNADTLELVRQGARKYSAQGLFPAYLAWAVLRVRSTGSEFLFTTTHLDPPSVAVRTAQWNQMIGWVGDLQGSLPVVSVGDFNTQKYHPLADTMLPAMRLAGFGDVQNQEYAVNPISEPRAESSVNGWVNSLNHERRDVASFGYEDQQWKSGNSIDWIFASNELRVKQWKTVLRFDPDTFQVRGVLPSDHNMVRATVVIP